MSRETEPKPGKIAEREFIPVKLPSAINPLLIGDFISIKRYNEKGLAQQQRSTDQKPAV